MQSDLIASFAAAQNDLVAAIDAGDTTAMLVATRALGAATDALRSAGALRADTGTRVQLEALLKTNSAAAQRLRFLRDQTGQRIGALGGSEAGATYRAPLRAISTRV